MCKCSIHSSRQTPIHSLELAAIEAGGTDNGAPGIREKYHPNYYGAFVLDPEGHNVEVVCHEPETAEKIT